MRFFLFFVIFASASSKPGTFFRDFQCPSSYFCSKSLPRNFDRDSNCQCDSSCELYGDCCVNSAFYSPNGTRSAGRKWKCVSLMEYGGVYMRTECPSWWPSDGVRVKCEEGGVLKDGSYAATDPLAMTPVTSLRSRITYQNFYCAFCSDDSERSIYWIPRVECEDFLYYNSTLKNVNEEFVWSRLKFNRDVDRWGVYLDKDNVSREHLVPLTHVNHVKALAGQDFVACNVMVQMPERIEEDVRSCKEWIGRCPVDGLSDRKVKKLCHSYTAIAYVIGDASIRYRNVHCAMCNGQSLDKLTCRSDSMSRTVNHNSFAPSFAFLFDVNEASGDTVGTIKRCSGHGEIYDPFFKMCRQMVCLNSNYQLYEGHCVLHQDPKTNTTHTTNNTHSNINSTPSKPSSTPSKSSSTPSELSSTFSEPISMFSEPSSTYSKPSSTPSEPISTPSEFSSTLFNTSFTLFSSSFTVYNASSTLSNASFTLSNASFTLSNASSTLSNASSTLSNASFNTSFTLSTTISTLSSTISLLSTTENMNLATLNEEDNEIEDEEYDEGSNLGRNAAVPNGTVIGKAPKNSDCARFNISKFHYHLFANGSVYIDEYQSFFEPGDYVSGADESILICAPPATLTLENNLMSKFSSIMTYMTLSCLSISILCLLTHLLIFALIPEMRNLSGKNLASLCAALTLAYVTFILWQFQNFIPKMLCTALGVLLYYSFLSTFFWMNTIAFDVLRSLRMATSQLRVCRGKQSVKFLFYSAYSWFGPVALVAAALGVEHADVPNIYKPGFGSISCWFASRRALLLFFVLPIVLIVLVNALLFTFSSYIIVTTSRRSLLFHPHCKVRRNFRLYLRLALLMGFGWLFGILAGIVDKEPLWYVFLVLNSLQGLFIFAAFTCTPKVKAQMKAKMGFGEKKNDYFGRRKFKSQKKLEPVESSESRGSEASSRMSTRSGIRSLFL